MPCKYHPYWDVSRSPPGMTQSLPGGNIPGSNKVGGLQALFHHAVQDLPGALIQF